MGLYVLNLTQHEEILISTIQKSQFITTMSIIFDKAVIIQIGVIVIK